MVGLASDSRDNRAMQEARFLSAVQEYRSRLRDICTGLDPHIGATVERDLDYLLMQAANLAREPLMRHMVKLTEAAAALAPSPFRVYPNPRNGAES